MYLHNLINSSSPGPNSSGIGGEDEEQKNKWMVVIAQTHFYETPKFTVTNDEMKEQCQAKNDGVRPPLHEAS